MRNRSLLGLALMLGVSGLAFGQANVAGKWSGTVAGRGGEQPITLELTVSGTAITGKLTTGQGQPVDIANAKLEGTKLTFTAAGGGRGGGGGAPGGGAPPAAGAPPAGGGAPGGGGGGRGGGGAQNYEAVLNAAGTEMSVTRTPAAAAAAPAGAPPAGGAPPAAAGAPGGGGGGGGRGGGGPVTFTLKKG